MEQEQIPGGSCSPGQFSPGLPEHEFVALVCVPPACRADRLDKAAQSRLVLREVEDLGDVAAPAQRAVGEGCEKVASKTKIII